MKTILNKLFEYSNLTKQESRLLLHGIAQGRYNDTQIASLMTVFQMRNISLDELDGFRDGLLELGQPIDLGGVKAIDIVGTGGDGKDTFNISTCASFVVAAAGYPVVKHGNYAASSVSGASNVIEKHGVCFSANEDVLKRSLQQCGIAYLHAPLFNPAMKAVAGIRKGLGVRSFFNILGPMVNPALPAYQLLGVYNLAMQRLYCYLLENSQISFSVVHSLDGYDEIALTDAFKVCSLQGERIYQPSDLGLPQCRPEELYGGVTLDQAVAIFDNVLDNNASEAQKNSVLANAAFAIGVMCPQKPITDCLQQARQALESGKAKETFKKFVTINS